MRNLKIFALVAGLFATMAAMAQGDFIASDEPTGGAWATNTHWYFVQFASSDAYHRAGYLSSVGRNHVHADGHLKLEGAEKPMANAGLWCMVGNETDGYRFYNKAMGPNYVLGFDGNAATMCEATDASATLAFDYAQSNASLEGGPYATFKLHGSDNNYWNNRDDLSSYRGTCMLGTWNSSNALGDKGSAIRLTKATDEELAKLDALELAFTPATITDGAFSSGTKWYRMKIRDGKKVLLNFWTGHNANDGANDNSTYTGLYTFVGNLVDGFHIHNAAGGPNYALYGLGNNNEILSWSATPSTFYLRQNTASGYQFQLGTTDTKYINDVNNELGLWVSSWAATDGGSTFTFEEATADELAAAESSWAAAATTIYGLKDTYVNNFPAGTNPGWYRQDAVNALNACLAACAAESGRTLGNMNQLFEAYWAMPSSIVLPKADKYYKLANARAEGEYLLEKYDLLQDDAYTFFCGEPGANHVPALWQFEPMTDAGKAGLYHIKNLNSGLYVSKSSWDYTMRMLPADGEIGEFNITAKNWVDMAGGVNLWDPTHDGTATVQADGTVKTWKATGSENMFFIEEASEIPVTVGPSGYATLNLPFAVRIPSGVKAYTAVEGEDVLQLAEITGGVISARTPVILTADPDTYRFAIAYGNADAALPTALSGTLVPEVIAENATAYILKSGDTGVAMYLVNSADDRTLPANKAYLGSTTAPVSVKRLVIGGSTTGIAGLETAGAGKADIYSLDGRRVTRASKGLYIVGGKKIFMK